MEVTETPIKLLERTMRLMEKYGVWKIIQGILLIGLLLYVIFNINTIPDTIRNIIHQDKIEDVATHDAAIEVRKQIKPQIDRILNKTLHDVDADRIFVLEMHNGTNNPSGLPFLYVEMTYCAVADNVEHIDDDYVNINLSRFEFPYFLETQHYWYGRIEDLMKVDSKLALRLQSNDAKYFAIMTIQGIQTELGYFGVTFTRDISIDNTDTLMMKLTDATQQLAALLDKTALDIEARLEKS